MQLLLHLCVLASGIVGKSHRRRADILLRRLAEVAERRELSDAREMEMGEGAGRINEARVLDFEGDGSLCVVVFLDERYPRPSERVGEDDAPRPAGSLLQGLPLAQGFISKLVQDKREVGEDANHLHKCEIGKR